MKIYTTSLRWDVETEEGKRAWEKLNNRSQRYGSISNYLLASVLDYQEKPTKEQLRQIIREELVQVLGLESKKIKDETKAVFEEQKEIMEETDVPKRTVSLGFEDWELSDIPLE